MQNTEARKELRRWRLIDKEWTATETAKRIGISRVMLWNIEKGHQRPGPETAERIERLTGIPANTWRKAS
jgi:transcriptional regulator with XRE-family HTH domain